MKTSDKILTLLAVFISFLALTVSTIQTSILQKQTYAAVWPRLSNGQGQGADYYIATVNNDGVGPAIITSVNYNYKDTSFQYIKKLIHYFGDLEANEIGRSVKLNFKYSDITEGDVMTPNEKVDVFEAQDSNSVAIGKKYFAETDIQMEYCSIYNDCWLMKNHKIAEIK